MNKPIVDGIISVANRKLRVEGIESYKEYLSQVYYFQKDIDEAVKEERDRIVEIIKSHIEPTYPINCKSIIDEINDIPEAID